MKQNITLYMKHYVKGRILKTKNQKLCSKNMKNNKYLLSSCDIKKKNRKKSTSSYHRYTLCHHDGIFKLN